MWKLMVILLFFLVPQALLQTTNEDLETADTRTTNEDLDISDARTDNNLCIVHDIVSYTITEETPLEEYGRFAEHYRRLGIKGAMRDVVSTDS